MKTSNDPRHQARRLALAVLYFDKLNPNKFDNEDLDDLIEALEIKKYNHDFYQGLIESVQQNLDKIHKVLEGNTSDWDLTSLFKIDLTILEIAVYELMKKDAPEKVVIDEAIELSKEFSTGESSKFINGVLAGLLKNDGDTIS